MRRAALTALCAVGLRLDASSGPFPNLTPYQIDSDYESCIVDYYPDDVEKCLECVEENFDFWNDYLDSVLEYWQAADSEAYEACLATPGFTLEECGYAYRAALKSDYNYVSKYYTWSEEDSETYWDWCYPI